MQPDPSVSKVAGHFFEYKDAQKKEGASKAGKMRFDLAEGLRTEDQRYASLPDCQSSLLKRKLAIYLNVAIENISIFAGADEVIEIVPRLYLNNGESALVIVPTFERMIATNYKVGGSAVPFPLKAENNFKIGDDDVLEITARARAVNARIIWTCTPNNPTGQVVSLDRISSIARKNSACLVVVNEVYQEYFSCNSDKSATTLIRDYPNVLVIRSFSKAFGLAGARVGYAVASEEVIASLERFKLLYCASTPAQELARVVLEPASIEKMKNEIKEMKAEKDSLEKFIGGLNQLEYIQDSETNFLLLRHKTKDIFNKLHKAGIAVSDWRTALGIKDMGFVRVSIHRADLNQKLKNVLALINGEDARSGIDS